MTREEIMNVPAGKDLDVLIAKHVMNKKVVSGKLLSEITNRRRSILNYSRAIFSAWMVVERIHTKRLGGLSLECNYYESGAKYWSARFGVQRFVTADTEMLAICRAALLAVMEAE